MAVEGVGVTSVAVAAARALEDTPEARARLAELARATGMPMDDMLARVDPPDPARVLGNAGWDSDEVSVADLQTRYLRALDPTAATASPSRGGFVIADSRMSSTDASIPANGGPTAPGESSGSESTGGSIR